MAEKLQFRTTLIIGPNSNFFEGVWSKLNPMLFPGYSPLSVVDTVESEWNVLVGAESTTTWQELSSVEAPTEKPAPYGEGSAAEQVADVSESTIFGESI